MEDINHFWARCKDPRDIYDLTKFKAGEEFVPRGPPRMFDLFGYLLFTSHTIQLAEARRNCLHQNRVPMMSLLQVLSNWPNPPRPQPQRLRAFVLCSMYSASQLQASDDEAPWMSVRRQQPHGLLSANVMWQTRNPVARGQHGEPFYLIAPLRDSECQLPLRGARILQNTCPTPTRRPKTLNSN